MIGGTRCGTRSHMTKRGVGDWQRMLDVFAQSPTPETAPLRLIPGLEITARMQVRHPFPEKPRAPGGASSVHFRIPFELLAGSGEILSMNSRENIEVMDDVVVTQSPAWKTVDSECASNYCGASWRRRHYPPGASTWNPIEHRLFSQISRNWQGVPLETYDTVLNYISTTRTSAGLTAAAKLNSKTDQKGQEVTDQEMKLLSIRRHRTLPAWYYTINLTTRTGHEHCEVVFAWSLGGSEMATAPTGAGPGDGSGLREPGSADETPTASGGPPMPSSRQ